MDNKKYHIEYLPIAEVDLTEIIEYVQNDSPGAALKLLDQIDHEISKLEDFPYIGQVPNDARLKSLNYRMLVVSSYLIFYVVFDDIVEIRRILHGRRKYDFLF